MRIEKITDYSKPEEGNKFQELAHKIYVGIYLQYYWYVRPQNMEERYGARW